jgi:hypothetical protein
MVPGAAASTAAAGADDDIDDDDDEVRCCEIRIAVICLSSWILSPPLLLADAAAEWEEEPWVAGW